mgnify:CR=1 FL=1
MSVDPEVALQTRQCFWLVFDTHQAVLDPELLGAYFGGPPPAAASKGQFQPCLLEQADAKAVSHIKAFLELPFRVEPEATIR